MNKTELGWMTEKMALDYLQAAGLQLVARNYKTPGRGGGEVDLIMHANDAEQTLVFVEVRHRANLAHGGAAASVSASKKKRLIFAARVYLTRFSQEPPPCRFDVVSIEGALNLQPQITWIPGAFDAPSL